MHSIIISNGINVAFSNIFTGCPFKENLAASEASQVPAGLVKIAEGDELRVCLYSFVDSAVCLHFWNLFETPCIYASRKAPFDFEMRSIFSCFIIAILRAKARFWWGVSSKQNSHFVWMRTTRNDACWKVLFLSRKSKWLFMRVNPLTVLQICIMMHILRWKNVHCNKAITQHFIYLPFWDARFLIEKYFRLI